MPVIFLTALSSEDDRIRGFRLGADDYVTKPFASRSSISGRQDARRSQTSVAETASTSAARAARGPVSGRPVVCC